ncbi:LADA_0H00408g1_1 [Lachancea dasiensis]|uniref:LADA_0H00408g1_1 n=1 Tax=Lachancea dasiensis TaxID=1072105 RepID=A0A1G4JYT2_9SACH|nr:LADA_0H00408g1_1 [Lachancea dasiensis]
MHQQVGGNTYPAPGPVISIPTKAVFLRHRQKCWKDGSRADRLGSYDHETSGGHYRAPLSLYRSILQFLRVEKPPARLRVVSGSHKGNNEQRWSVSRDRLGPNMPSHVGAFDIRPKLPRDTKLSVVPCDLCSPFLCFAWWRRRCRWRCWPKKCKDCEVTSAFSRCAGHLNRARSHPPVSLFPSIPFS